MTATEWIAIVVEGCIIAASGVIRENWERIERWALHVFEFIVVSAIILEIVILF